MRLPFKLSILSTEKKMELCPFRPHFARQTSLWQAILAMSPNRRNKCKYDWKEVMIKFNQSIPSNNWFEGMVWCLITIQSSAGGIYEDINQRRNGYDRVILLERSRAILIWWDLSKSCGSYGQAQKARIWWSETEKCKKLTVSNPFYRVYMKAMGRFDFYMVLFLLS